MSTNDKYRAVFKRIETDDEFRERVRAKGATYLIVENKVKRWHAWPYGHVEEHTERESVRLDSLMGERLDDAAWLAYKMQRRLVEDVSR